jgi:hypothetical protein
MLNSKRVSCCTAVGTFNSSSSAAAILLPCSPSEKLKMLDDGVVVNVIAVNLECSVH